MIFSYGRVSKEREKENGLYWAQGCGVLGHYRKGRLGEALTEDEYKKIRDKLSDNEIKVMIANEWRYGESTSDPIDDVEEGLRKTYELL